MRSEKLPDALRPSVLIDVAAWVADIAAGTGGEEVMGLQPIMSGPRPGRSG